MSLIREGRTCVEEYAERSKHTIRVFYVAGRNNHSLHMTGDEEARENEDYMSEKTMRKWSTMNSASC